MHHFCPTHVDKIAKIWQICGSQSDPQFGPIACGWSMDSGKYQPKLRLGSSVMRVSFLVARKSKILNIKRIENNEFSIDSINKIAKKLEWIFISTSVKSIGLMSKIQSTSLQAANLGFFDVDGPSSSFSPSSTSPAIASICLKKKRKLNLLVKFKPNCQWYSHLNPSFVRFCICFLDPFLQSLAGIRLVTIDFKIHSPLAKINSLSMQLFADGILQHETRVNKVIYR